jgi:hypothetical protein
LFVIPRCLFVIPRCCRPFFCLSFRSEAEESAVCPLPGTTPKQAEHRPYFQLLTNSPPKNPEKSLVKPQNHATPCQQTTYAWHISPISCRIIKEEKRKKAFNRRIEGFSF